MKVGSVEAALRGAAQTKGSICLTLLDSETFSIDHAIEVSKLAEQLGCSGIMVGGSTITDQMEIESLVKSLKDNVGIPIILFPGNISGVSRYADAILFTSLLNSDNPYFITQAQALGALTVKKHGIEPLPTAYLIIGEGGATGFVGRARGIPPSKPKIAAMYALAAQYLGMRFLYLESGSGASSHVPAEVVATVRKVYDGFLIVGGGIREPESARIIAAAGADAIVVGTLLESNDYKTIFPQIMEAITGK